MGFSEMDLMGHDPTHVEAVLVAADRLREAYEAMMEGRDVGWLADWQPAPTRGAIEALRVVSEEAILYGDRCVQPGCDGQGFYSARCQSGGHRKEIVEYVPASQLRGAVEALREIAGGGYDDDHGKWRYYSQVDMRQIANRALDRLGGQ